MKRERNFAEINLILFSDVIPTLSTTIFKLWQWDIHRRITHIIELKLPYQREKACSISFQECAENLQNYSYKIAG